MQITLESENRRTKKKADSSFMAKRKPSARLIYLYLAEFSSILYFSI